MKKRIRMENRLNLRKGNKLIEKVTDGWKYDETLWPFYSS